MGGEEPVIRFAFLQTLLHERRCFTEDWMAQTTDFADMYVAQLCDWGRDTRNNEEEGESCIYSRDTAKQHWPSTA